MVLWLRPWQERHAATLGPAESASRAGTETETEGPPPQSARTGSRRSAARKRKRGRKDKRTTTGADTTTGTGSRPAAHPPGRERHEGPERIHPRQHRQQRGRTPTPPREDGRTDRQTDRQTPSAAKGPRHLDTGKHLDSIGNGRTREQDHHHGSRQQPPRRTKSRNGNKPRPLQRLKNRNRRENGKAPGHLANSFLPSDEISKDRKARRRLKSAPTFYIE